MTVSDVDAGTAAPPTRPGRRPPWAAVVAIVAVAVLVAVVVSRWTSGGGDEATDTSSTLGAPVQTAIDEAVGKAVAAQSQAVAAAFQKIQPSVVEIDIVPDASVPTTAEGELAGLGTGRHRQRRRHDPDRPPRRRPRRDDRGRVRRRHPLGRRGRRPRTPQRDIAVLRPATLPSVVVPAVLGSDGIGVGLPVVAVGNPLGLDDTTTPGVISASTARSEADDGTTQRRPHPVRRRRQPGQLGRPAAQPRRRGDRHRRRPRRPVRRRVLHRHRLRGAHRRRRRRRWGRPATAVTIRQ